MLKYLFTLSGDESVCQQFLNLTSASSASDSEAVKSKVEVGNKSKYIIFYSVVLCPNFCLTL